MRKITSLVIGSVLFTTTSLLANSMVLQESTDGMVNGKSVANVTVLSPVERLSTNGEMTTVKIKGYRQESYPQMVVRDMKRGEIYILFHANEEKLAQQTFKKIKEFEDEYGEIWHEVEGIVDIKSAVLTQDISTLNEKAKTTYEQTCSMCHRLHAPKDFTVNQWPHQVESMMTEIPLELPVKELIVKYLQHNAVDAK